jgi:hypothetical protein
MKIGGNIFHYRRDAGTIDLFPPAPVAETFACNGTGTPPKKNTHALQVGPAKGGSLARHEVFPFFVAPCPVESEANSTPVKRKGESPRR